MTNHDPAGVAGPDADRLAHRFEDHRGQLRAVAYRLLGSLAEADDAVQETWLRLDRTDTARVENLGGWLTTITARICLDMLRTRRSRREHPLDTHLPDPVISDDSADPQQQALRSDAVGLALLVVLDALSPAERLAYVLHDMFTVPFAQIAPIVDRTPAAARQLASRARRRVRASTLRPDPDLTRQRQAVDAFLTAARDGDFDALITVLDPDVVLRADLGTTTRRSRGATTVAHQALSYAWRADLAQPVLVNGTAGLLVTSQRHPIAVMAFTVTAGTIVEIDILADRTRLRQLPLPLPGTRP